MDCGWIGPGADGSTCQHVNRSDLKIPVGGTQYYDAIEIDYLCNVGDMGPVYVGNATWRSVSPDVAEIGSGVANVLVALSRVALKLLA